MSGSAVSAGARTSPDGCQDQLQSPGLSESRPGAPVTRHTDVSVSWVSSSPGNFSARLLKFLYSQKILAKLTSSLHSRVKQGESYQWQSSDKKYLAWWYFPPANKLIKRRCVTSQLLWFYSEWWLIVFILETPSRGCVTGVTAQWRHLTLSQDVTWK